MSASACSIRGLWTDAIPSKSVRLTEGVCAIAGENSMIASRRFSISFPRTNGNNGMTAFPKTEAEMRRRLRHLRIDKEGLNRPIKACRLDCCHATCCHDGVILGEEEAQVLRAAVAKEESFFSSV